MTNKTEKVLMIHSGALGDCILLSRFIVSALPDANLTAACHSEKADLLVSSLIASNGINMELLKLDSLFDNYFESDSNSNNLGDKLAPFDLVISAFGFGDDKISQRLKGITKDCRFVNARPTPNGGKHIWDIWQTQCGLKPKPAKIKQWIPAETELNAAKSMLAGLGLKSKKINCIHPGAGSRKKCWPIENYAAIAKSLEDPSIFICGEVETERLSHADFTLLNNAGHVIRPDNLKMLAAIISQAKRFVGNDSGPAHLAAALGIETTVLFARNASLLELFCPIMPSGKAAKTISANSIYEIKPDDVLAKAHSEKHSLN